MHSLGKASLVLAVLTAAACNDTTAPAPDDLLNADVAVVAADATLDGVQLMSDPNMHLGAPFDRSRTVTFYDENGVVQASYDPLLTASMNIKVDVSAERTREVWSATVERHRDLTVSGLLGEETTRTFNGGGTEHIQRSRMSDEFGTRSHDISGDFTWDNVVVPVPGSATPWPLSGTITRHWVIVVTNGRNGDETRERTVVVTFNGTQFATINVNGETSELDLATRPGKFFGSMFTRMRTRQGRGG
jgi:hypothetical protein